jgi:hypothetical protein
LLKLDWRFGFDDHDGASPFHTNASALDVFPRADRNCREPASPPDVVAAT